MGAQDLYDVTLIPSLGPEDVGLPPMPQAPQAPMLGPDPGQGRKRKATAIGAALASLIGGPSAYGVPSGVLRAFDDQDRDQQVRDQQAQQVYGQQAREYDQQAQSYAQAHQSRQMQLQQAVRTIQAQAQTITTKDDYDQRIEGYARMLQGAGFRVDGNWLRQAVPFVQPNAEKDAQALYDEWLSKPNNKKLMESNPEAAAKAFVPFDRDGDGVAERVSIADLGVLARQIATDEQGKPVYAPQDAGRVTEIKANADGILQQLIAQDVAEGKGQPDPKRLLVLQQKAITLVDQAKPPDPTLEAIRQLQLDNARKGAQEGNLPPGVRSRVDAKAKGFDSQPVVKRVQTQAEAVSFANSLDPNTKNPADDQALIYAFAKAMDPDSVVREGEYATVQKYAQSWADSFGFNAQRIFSNTAFLTPQARANMKATIAKRYQAGKAQYDNLRKSYADQINRITGKPDGEAHLTDYAGAFPEATATPEASGAEQWVRDPATGKMRKQ
jgi:hypothetical protein